jgi:hypothetical protein
MRSIRPPICGSSIAALLVLLLGLSARARAEDPEAARLAKFREEYDRAGKAYNAKDYAVAIPSLQRAYAIQPLPALLFNIAQAHRKLEHFGPARVYFELYRSTAPDLTPEKTDVVERSIREMEEREKERERAARTTQVIEKTRTLYVQVQSEKPPPRWLRPLGLVTGIAGFGLVLSGATFLGLDGRCRSPAMPPALECAQVYNTSTLGAVLTSVGGGALILGTVTFGLSLRRPARPVLKPQEAPPSDLMPVLPLEMTSTATPDVEPPPAGWNSDGSRKKR